MIDFELQKGNLSTLLAERNVFTFFEACEFVKRLPYRRISNPNKLELVLIESQGTCSSKHAFLSQLAIDNKRDEVELICGIFFMSAETHPALTSFFETKNYSFIPEAHCYLKINNERFDFTSSVNRMNEIALKLVREQRIDPNQANEWKVLTHKDYLKKFLARKPEFEMTFDQLWNDREKCIEILSNSY